jgi:hypothetical protein
MQTLFDRMKDALADDDLFWRVSCAFWALFAAAVGGFIAWLLVASSARQDMASLLYALLWLIALAFLAWSAVLLVGCVSPLESRSMRRAGKVLPSIVSVDGQEGLLAYVTFLPAAVVTLALRAVGIRGCRSADSAQLIDEAQRNSRSNLPRFDV